WRERVHGCAVVSAPAQCFLEAGRPAVLAQEVAKRFVGELLEILHLIAGQKVERVPGLGIELHALARHLVFQLASLRRSSLRSNRDRKTAASNGSEKQ